LSNGPDGALPGKGHGAPLLLRRRRLRSRRLALRGCRL